MESPRPKTLELGVFLIIAALPLAFLPFTLSPFADVKLVVLMGGTLAVWLGAPPGERRLLQAATAWVVVTLLAAIVGVDRGISLTASQSGESSGFLIVLASAVLLIGGPGIDAALLERARRWLVWVCVIVAVFGIAFRLDPGLFVHVVANDASIGATLGNQLFAATFLAAGIAAALGGARVSPRDLGLAAVVALGIASFGERSSLLLPPLMCGVMIWRIRPSIRTAVLICVAVLGPLALWQAAEPLLPSNGAQGAVSQFGASETDSQRFLVWGVLAGAALDRPILGWGPGTTQSVYLHAATTGDVARTTRLWADGHDLFLETLVSSGLLGLLSLLTVVVVVVPRALRSPPERAWALATAIALAAYALFEPVGIVLTPLLFLFAGIATGPGREAARPIRRAWRWAAGGVMVVGIAVSGLMLTASTLQRWGDDQGEAWAYRTALDLAPWRVSAAEALALRLVSDSHSADPSVAEPAAAEARSVIDDAVAGHPWDPNVRLTAIQVQVFLREYPAALDWAEQQAARFPSEAFRVADMRKLAAGRAGS
ncbi:MAG: O-antigen ligase family protein [Actinomycetota bacterium]